MFAFGIIRIEAEKVRFCCIFNVFLFWATRLVFSFGALFASLPAISGFPVKAPKDLLFKRQLPANKTKKMEKH